MSGDAGAPASNTVSANYTAEGPTGIAALRYGVDSLYLSYPGQLSSQWEQRLLGLKLAAKETEEVERSRAQDIRLHYSSGHFSGWSIGFGSGLGARIYDKTREIAKSGKAYLEPLWAAGGWKKGQTVWRLEFQFEREVLKELSVKTLPDLLAQLGGLWRYATEDWLRLTLPRASDKNQTRWPTHPFCSELAPVDWQCAASPSLQRVRREYVPPDDVLFVMGLGGITSFMAREGITDPSEGFGEFLARAQRYHDSLRREHGRGFFRYVHGKVAAKGRRYNTLDNRIVDAAEVKADAHAYRTARDVE